MKRTICIILAALMLGGVIGYAASSAQPFVDVPVGAWYEKAVAWAYECGELIKPAYKMSVEQLAAYTQDRYGRKLCAECAKKVKPDESDG